MTYLIFALFFVAVLLIVLAFAKPQSKEEASSRLQYIKARKASLEQEQRDLQIRAKALGQFAQDSQSRLAPFANRLLPDNLRGVIRKKLDHAGLYDVTTEQHAVQQLLFMIGLPAAFLVLNPIILRYPMSTVLYGLPVLLALGYYYPIVRLNSRIEARRREMFRAFPDFVDLLTICLEAGMGLDAALKLLTDKGQAGPLREEFAKTTKEIKVGKPRVMALRDMAKRIEMKEITSFVVALAQAEQIGGNLSQTLKVQSEIARDARWQKAQEMAQKAPVKLLFPMILLIFPNIFLIIFGPLVLDFVTGKL
jgi:Flp pilus assembly protein TadB